MERATSACKVIKSPWTAAAPKCKIGSHGLGRKNCLIQIVRRLNLRIYLYKDESKTAWLRSSKETIGIEKKHIQSLGIDMLRFFKPNFKKTRKQSQDLQVVPLVVPDRLYYFNQLEEEEPSTSTLIAENVSSGSDTICNQPNELIIYKASSGEFRQISLDKLLNKELVQEISDTICTEPNEPIIYKASSGEFKQISLDKLLNEEIVQQISSKDLVAHIKAYAAKVMYRPLLNRVGKDYEKSRISNYREHLNSHMVLRASNRPKCTTDLIGFRRVMVSKKAYKNPVLALKDPSKRLFAAELSRKVYRMLEIRIKEAQDIIKKKAELNGELPNFEQTDLDPSLKLVCREQVEIAMQERFGELISKQDYIRSNLTDSGIGLGFIVEAPDDCPPRMAEILPEPQFHRHVEYDLENIFPLPQRNRYNFGQLLRKVDYGLFIASVLLLLYFVFGNTRAMIVFHEWLLRLYDEFQNYFF